MWWCDVCGEQIEKVEHGWVEWLRDIHDDKFPRECKGLRLVHYRECLYDSRSEFEAGWATQDLHLKDFLGTDGLIRLLRIHQDSKLPAGQVEQMIARLHIPGFEQARHHLAEALNEGVLEPEPDGLIWSEQIERINKWASSK